MHCVDAVIDLRRSRVDVTLLLNISNICQIRGSQQTLYRLLKFFELRALPVVKMKTCLLIRNLNWLMPMIGDSLISLGALMLKKENADLVVLTLKQRNKHINSNIIAASILDVKRETHKTRAHTQT